DTIVNPGIPHVSITRNYRIHTGIPPAPTSLDAAIQSGGVPLTWQQADVAAATTYRLFRDTSITGTPLAVFSADRRSYVDQTAAPGQHVYQLVLLDAAGDQSPAA